MDNINECVAKALGWRVVVGRMTKDHELLRPMWIDVPLYSTDIRAAWEVVDHLKEKGYAVKVVDMMMVGTCVINYNGGEALSSSNEDNVPLAISKAFLKLKEGERD